MKNLQNTLLFETNLLKVRVHFMPNRYPIWSKVGGFRSFAYDVTFVNRAYTSVSRL